MVVGQSAGHADLAALGDMLGGGVDLGAEHSHRDIHGPVVRPVYGDLQVRDWTGCGRADLGVFCQSADEAGGVHSWAPFELVSI
jgi:hypothetical protein